MNMLTGTRLRGRGALFALFFFLSTLAGPFAEAAAQSPGQAPRPHADLERADAMLARGQVEEAIALLQETLNGSTLSPEDRVGGFRLLALAYLAKDSTEDARESIRRLLEIAPAYEPDPDTHSPALVRLIKEVQLESVKIVPPAEVKPAGSPWWKRWWVWGGGTVAAATAGYLLWPEPRDENQPLPGMPGFPADP